MTDIYYLGPEGTFTHQAAIAAAEGLASHGEHDARLHACADVPQILRHVAAGEGLGVIAWENNVEGYVVPNLDMMIDAIDVAAFMRVGVDVTFDAFVTAATAQHAQDRDHILASCSVVTAHPHGLAQCRAFADCYGLRAVPASSNAAACRDLREGDVGLGPSICGELYGLDRVATHVEDFAGARTEFLVVAPRARVQQLLADARERGVREFESILTFIPLATGPGVLADLLDVVRDAGLNMTSFISRPIKGHDGTYSFIVTLDAAPWEPRFRETLIEIAEHGDWLKTLAVYPRQERPHPPVDEWMLPQGGVRCNAGTLQEAWQGDASMRKELLW